jgi:hypothetical protein
MKMVSSTILCKGFALCRGRMTKNDTFNYTKEITSEDAKFSQIMYLLEGGGMTPLGPAAFDNNKLVDFRDFYKKEYSLSCDERGATWICINPIPADNFFDVTLLEGGNNYTFEPDINKEQIILCVENYITINNKIFNQFNYTRIIDKNATVNIPDSSEALFLSREKR